MRLSLAASCRADMRASHHHLTVSYSTSEQIGPISLSLEITSQTWRFLSACNLLSRKSGGKQGKTWGNDPRRTELGCIRPEVRFPVSRIKEVWMRPVSYITLCCPQNIVELLTPRSVHLIGFQPLSISSSFDPEPFIFLKCCSVQITAPTILAEMRLS